MDYSDVFRLVNLVIGVLMVLGGVGQFFPELGFQAIVIGVYVMVFGLGIWTGGICADGGGRPAIGLLEFQIPPYVSRYASFLFSFLGRGVFYVFVGCILLHKPWFHIVPGTIIGVVGLAYVVLEFIPSIEPPHNMRDADNAWGAEQV
ncbi:MAG: hypothetical protein M4579_004837 [Chaenotheca gracillima]|nr:MAG: hypothetical protein M4579_004837 [Chaenotheca gracillima]